MTDHIGALYGMIACCAAVGVGYTILFITRLLGIHRS
jgi:hypothetical protein